MPAKSKEQQRLFGMVHAYQKGELKDASKEVKDIAKSISYKDADDFASTKRKGLPNKVSDKKKSKESMKESVIKINEDGLRQIVAESVKRVLKEALLGDKEPDENGCLLMTGEQVFDEIDKELSRFGDAHVSRFYSDNGNVVIAVHKDIYFKCREEVKGIMGEYGYRFYDVGQDGDYAMMTFKSECGLTLNEK